MIPSGKARVAGVFGWPVGHSKSPRLHGYWLDHYKIDGAYIPLPVSPENFIEALRALPRLGFAGANVTLPHKEAALAAVDRADPQARRIGAVNTIVVASDGTLDGSNTDGYGFLENLHQAAPGFDAAAGPAVVLGAGGAARALIAALIDAGAPEIRVVNRTPERAATLIEALGGPCRQVPWAERAAALDGAALLVNATRLGMTGQASLDLALDRLPKSALVNDIVYAPLETALLKSAKARGNRVVDGLGMLLHQARPGFRAWFGTDPEVTPALRAFVLAD
ncbi:MAG: shikimate dehydrogenase [Candidatus Eiseniibacteriota bacterium]